MTEARRVFEGLIERQHGRRVRALHALVLRPRGALPVPPGRCRGVEAALDEGALELLRELGDEVEAGRCLAELGSVAVYEGDLDRRGEPVPGVRRPLPKQRQPVRLCIALSNLGALASMRGDSRRRRASRRRCFRYSARSATATASRSACTTSAERRSSAAVRPRARAARRGARARGRARLQGGDRVLPSGRGGAGRAGARCAASAARHWRSWTRSASPRRRRGVGLRGDARPPRRGARRSRVEELLAEGRSAPRDEIVAGALLTT